MTITKKLGRNLHYGASLLLALMLLPLLHKSGIPFRYNIKVFGLTYLLVAMQSIVLASLLYFFSMPQQIMGSFMGRLLRNKIRIPFLLVYFLVLIWILPILKVIVAMFVTISLIEILERNYSDKSRIMRLVGPALYILAGLVLVASYNDIILSVRRFVDDDLLFSNMDKWILHGNTISMASHWAIGRFPLSFFHFLEFIYYGLFPVIGAGVIFSTFGYEPSRGMRFAGAILTSYYITLGAFYLWPSLGPYYLCANHFSLFPHQLETYTLQKNSIQGAWALWNQIPLKTISFEYYIAFPCMHITQSLIVLWFFRRWKTLFIIFLAYNALLLGAIVLLEWHYFVDILAGVLVAAIAIMTVDSPFAIDRDRAEPQKELRGMNSHHAQII